MNYLSEIAKDPLVVAAIAGLLLLISIMPLLRRGRDGQKAQQRREAAIRAATIDKLQASNSFQMLELTEEDARAVIDVVLRDDVKLEGKYKRAAQHIQTAVYERMSATLSEDQITAVLVAYQQARTE